MNRKVVTLALLVVTACAGGQDTADPAIQQTAAAQDDLIQSAESAGPATVAADSTIMDWSLNVVREGTNGWTCLPDRPDTPGVDPWCVNDPWLDFLQAYVCGTEPTYSEFGIAYMLAGDSPVSNSDPFATEPTGPEDWVTDLHSHMMFLLPDRSKLDGFSTDHLNGGPWVMWPDTPYAHLMVPIDAR